MKLFSALIVVAVALLVASVVVVVADESIVAELETVKLNPDEMLVVSFEGQEAVYVAYSAPPQVRVTLEEISSSGCSGVVKLAIVNSSGGVYECEVMLFSSKPFTLSIRKSSSYASTSEVQSYHCPANVTFRLVVPIALNWQSNTTSTSSNEAIPVSLWAVDPWKVAVYCFFIPLFGVTAALDVRDMKRRRAGKWGFLESFSLFVRYMFYAFLLSFAAIALGTFAFFIYSSATGFSVDLRLGDLLISFLAFMAFGVVYAIGKWRGWYELVDEED
ncbi:MAG: hypothetical protein DRJ68_05215 [Thermoprotei archaeon]|nr:MAG: hypothetical protein DRJ62_00905 [Thermoprotei archaeon]RLF20180.1 MAG: hypothetical protein DRJ68_05215 [Thermoprotei archaeon]